ncbi:MAG TPA: hypothetical protein VGX23_14510 [Actinocrinis sp.]|nr:hypothetical protein [Actinocrinis sp.]
MRGLTKRAVVLPMAALSAAALVAVAGGVAQADVSAGTVTLTVNTSFLAQLAKSGVVLLPGDYSSVTYNSSGTVAVTYAATGGDASLVFSAGTVTASGGILGFSLNGHTVDLGSLLFDLTDAQFDGATSTSGEVPLVDLAGSQAGLISGTTQTYTASDLVIDPAGAALLDSALHTTAFYGGQDVGSFAASWTAS